MPVPCRPARLVVKKGSKIRWRIASGTPGPVSVTSTSTRPAWLTEVRMVSTFSNASPFSIACWALTIRLTSTWWSWSRSPSTGGRPVPKLTRTAMPAVRSAYSVSSSAEAISSLRSTRLALRVSRRRAMARKVWTIRAQRSAAAPILRARSSNAVPAASSCEHLGLADDRGERVVELVADAGEQRAERGQLLGLVQGLARARQLLLGALAVGDVEMDAADGVDLPSLRREARCRATGPSARRRRPDHPILELDRVARESSCGRNRAPAPNRRDGRRP